MNTYCRHPGDVTNIAQYMRGTFLYMILDTLQKFMKIECSEVSVELTNLGPILSKNLFSKMNEISQTIDGSCFLCQNIGQI